MVMELPRFVALESIDASKYLCPDVLINDDYRLGFSSATCKDVGYATVGQDIVTTHDQIIHLKSNWTNNHWHQDDDSCIRAANSSSSASLFQAIRVAKNKFCRSVKDGDNYYLKADMPTINGETSLGVEETVLSRSIYNFEFRETDGRIYNATDIKVAPREVVNHTNLEDTVELKLSYEDTRTCSWNFSASLMLGGRFSMEAGTVGTPLIINDGFEVLGSITLGLQYASTTSTKRLAETVYRVNVRPATEGKSNVPFSYTQCSALSRGETETYKNDNGVFTGTNAYNLRYETDDKGL